MTLFSSKVIVSNGILSSERYAMITTFFRRKTDPKKLTEPKQKYAISKIGKDLLSSTERQNHIRKIKRLFSITEDVWTNHYLHAIEQFAELVQEVPASEIHHHSNAGGLIDHTLEALHAGIRLAQGYVLPPNSEPEQIASTSDRWRFGAFIAILAHDLGKIVTDIEVVYRERGGEFQYWHPWYGNIPKGAEYSYRYKKRASNAKVAKSLHEKAAMSLLPKLLTIKAAQWLFEDTELLAQLFSTVTHSTFGGGAISEIVRRADSASVSKNLGADTGVRADHSSARPLHEKLIVSLRKLINDGDLKRNKPGAAVWVTENDTWVVSKATMEAVRVQLLEEGHNGIPKSVVRIFEVLREHDLLVPNVDGESVWTAEVNDFAKNWQQKLTFLRFNNSIIWPTSNPDKFDGEVVPVDKSGNVLEVDVNESATSHKVAESNDVEDLPAPASVQVPIMPTPSSLPQKAKVNGSNEAEKYIKLEKERTKIPSTTNSAQKPQVPVVADPQSTRNADVENPISKSEVIHSRVRSRKEQIAMLLENEFIAWMLNGISRRQIRVNESEAPIHILEHHVALVSPVIFNLYLDKNPIKKRLYEKRAGDKKVYTLLQKELESLDIHQRGSNGQNILRMSVEGQRSQSDLRVYLLNREYFPTLSNFSPNKAMTVQL